MRSMTRSFLAAVGAFGFALAGSAFAQDPESPPAASPPTAADSPTELDTLEVTGSRIKRSDFETSQPVFVINRADIERTGLNNIGDILQELPIAGSAVNSNVNNGASGQTELDLRNLGSNRVLVLVNGRRWVNGLNSFSSSSVDLNTIPVSIIERVEVLKDGASAVYGTDAIAGVVNIITRKNYQGADARAYWGQFTEGDGFTQAYSLSIGNTGTKSSVFVDLSFSEQDAVFAGDREFTSIPLANTGNTRGSSGQPQGRFLFAPDPTANVSPGCDTFVGPGPDLCDLTLTHGEDGLQATDFRARLPEDAYNFAPINYLMVPVERTALFAQTVYELASWVRFQSEMLYNARKSQQQQAHTPLFVGDLSGAPTDVIYIAADNPFNPFGQDIGRPDPNNINAIGFPVGSGFVGRRMIELGPRVFSQDVDTLRIGSGFSGSFDIWSAQVASWDAGFTWADSRNVEYQEGHLNLEHVRKALGPIADCNADPACVPLNLFGGQGPTGSGSMTQSMLDYIAYNGTGSQQQTLRNYYAVVSSEVLPLWAGPLAVALGVEYREETFEDIPDPFIAAGISSTNRALPTGGGYTAKEAFVELNLPLARDLVMLDYLEMVVAARSSRYSRFGEETTTKLGFKWNPVEDLLVRASVSEAFRAPSVSDLFLGLSDSFPDVSDPCSNYTTDPGTDPAVAANCGDPTNPANGGVAIPLSYEQINTQIVTRFGGNPALSPETAKTYTIGAVFNPDFIPDFTVAVDWYKIDLTNAITTLGPQFIMDDCYLNSTPGSPTASCVLIDRIGSSGIVNEIQNLFLNIGGTEVEGVDFGLDYRLPNPWPRLGGLRWLLDATYLVRYDDFTADGSGGLTRTEAAGENFGDFGFPRLRFTNSLLWNLGPFRAGWTARYVHHQDESCDDGFDPTLTALGICDSTDEFGPRHHVGSVTYHNIQGGYDWNAINLGVTVGINNVFDKEPPHSVTAFANSFDSGLNEVPGVFPYIRIAKGF